MRSCRAVRIATSPTNATVALLAALLLVAGCGEDDPASDGVPERPISAPEVVQPDSDSPTGVAPATEGDGFDLSFRKRADELCLATQRALSRAELEEFGKPSKDTPPPTRAERQRFVEEVVAPTWRGVAESLLRLEAPEAREAEIQAWISSLIDGVRSLGEPAAIIRDPGLEESALDDAEKAASDAGLRRCAEESVSVRDYAAVYEP